MKQTTPKERYTDIQQLYPREVLMQYPTHQVWRNESEVTLQEARERLILAERWGSSYEGYVVNQLIPPQPHTEEGR